MVDLSFRLSNSWNKQLTQKNLDLVDGIALRYNMFLGDIQFKIGLADFSMMVGWVPIIDFAAGMITVTKELENGQMEIEFEFTESDAKLLFQKLNGDIRVTATYTSSSAKVSMIDFSAAVTSFVNNLRTELLNQYPELAQNVVFKQIFI